ncbi:MAG: VCBS repeat-containing protein [Planctomycetes bacterium]|nr:VCBS repeat-containing protein [Planctomycetota bacterium]
MKKVYGVVMGLVVGLGIGSREAAARQCTPPDSPTAPSFQEWVVDDGGPFSTLTTGIAVHSLFALGVKAADFDQDGDLDVVVGGIDNTEPVKIYYLQTSPSGLVSVSHVETLDLQNSTPAAPFPNVDDSYGIDVGDANRDGKIDIFVGRRNQMGSLVPFSPGFNTNERDTVWINDGQRWDPVTGDPLETYMFDELLISGPRKLNPTNESITNSSSETFAIDVRNLDGLGIAGAPIQGIATLDVVTVGAYGIRIYLGDGAGNFTHYATMTDPGPAGVYRNVEFGDVDGDRDIDMVVTRDGLTSSSSTTIAPDRVWFNQTVNPAPGVTSLFSLMDKNGIVPPILVHPPILQYQWRGKAGTPFAGICGMCLSAPKRSIDCALGDIDGDDDLDLVVAATSARNPVYLNDGNGHFGAANQGQAGAGNGGYAHLFATATSDWPNDVGGFESSEFLFDVCLADIVAATAGFGTPTWGDIEFHLDGKIIDTTSSVRIVDADRDGLADVAFCNRNEIEEVAKAFPWLINPSHPQPYEYLSTNTHAPPCYDHLYYGVAPTGAPLVSFSFSTCAELIGKANDGTSYFEFVSLGGNLAPDWIEANFNNFVYEEPVGASVGGAGTAWNGWFWLGQAPIGPMCGTP